MTAGARRIATLLASGTEIVYALGLGERIVAVSHECDYPAQVRDKPRVTSTAVRVAASSAEIDAQVQEHTAQGRALYDIDAARLAELAPDLIVTQAQCDVCAVRYADVVEAVRRAPQLAQTRVVALNPMTLGGILDDVRAVGAAAGVPDAAERVMGELQARIDAVAAATRGLRAEDRPRVVCLEWIEPPMVAANWMPELLDLAGAAPGMTVAGRHSTYTDWADLRRYDPEVLIVMPCGFDLERTMIEFPRLREFDGWSELSAVRSGRVWAVDGNAYFNRSGPRMVDSLEILAHLVHPQRLGRPAAVFNTDEVWRHVGG